MTAAAAEAKSASEMEAVIACLSYAFCSTALSLCNKLVFSGANFNYPLAILAFQSLCAVVFLKGSDVLQISKPLPLQAGLFRLMTPVTLMFCAMLWTSGKALRFCSMPLFTVCKNLAVVGTTTYEYFRFGEKVSSGIVISLALMTGGSIIAGLGDISATPIGMVWLLSNVLLTIAYLAVLKERMPTDVSSASKTLHNNVLTLIIFLISSACAGELAPFCDKISQQSTAFKLGVLMTGVLGTAINMTTFWCMHVTNGATYAFVGACNKVPVALIGHFLFHSVITPLGWCGVTLGLGSGLTYALTKERERQARDRLDERQDFEAKRALLDTTSSISDPETGDDTDGETKTQWEPR